MTLVEIMLRAEAALDRQLAGIALIRPQDALKLSIRPEVDLAAKGFFLRLDRRKDEIFKADELASIHIAMGSVKQRDAWRILAAVDDVDTYAALSTIASELNAIRTARKAVRWVETSGLLESEGFYG